MAKTLVVTRRIDLLIAKEMGWRRGGGGPGKWSHNATRQWSVDEHCIPHYSTDIRQAWNLVKAMRLEGWWFQIQSHHGKDGGWECWVDHCSDPDKTRAICHDAKTPELAICIAFLKAKGVDAQFYEHESPPLPNPMITDPTYWRHPLMGSPPDIIPRE